MFPSRTTLVALTSSVVLAGLVGCSHDAPPPPLSPNTVSVTETTSATTVRPAGNLRLSAALLQACKIDVNNATTAPKFAFDATQMIGSDAATLDQVARCVTTGPLKGRSLALVGRADPRGPAQYNVTLGSDRAVSVSKYLESAGVPADQLSATSRGALDATGTNPDGWATDRRVDVDLK
jgi:peptidoglycan-associated lipoprotein